MPPLYSVMSASSSAIEAGEELTPAPDNIPALTPELDPTGMSLSMDEEHRERAKVRGGIMSRLLQVVLFSTVIPAGEADHFSIVPLEIFRSIPPDLTALQRIPQASRMEERVFRYKGPGDSSWKSYLFARVEDGKFVTSQPKTINFFQAFYSVP